MSHNKTVLLGITGCIAAYKSAEIVRGLQKKGVRVKVVMTEHACEFIGPTTFRALTSEPVAVGLFDAPGDPIHHISLTQEADLFVIAPCTANVIAKISHGIADDLLTTTALATTAPLIVAPAMNVNMYENPTTQENIEVLKDAGVSFVEPDEGYLACGDTGKGRLAEVEAIVSVVLEKLDIRQDLKDKNVLITAGPTHEMIDPVRFISNPSTGKMGYALAEAAYSRGATVTLISGPTGLAAPEGVTVIPIISANDMLNAVEPLFTDCDLAIFTAAVSDMRPKKAAEQKLKKGRDTEALSTIELVENPDILATMAAKKENQMVIGFAAETENVLENARIKLKSKGADLIVANDVSTETGFGTDDNKVWIVSPENIIESSHASKHEIADLILDSTV